MDRKNVRHAASSWDDWGNLPGRNDMVRRAVSEDQGEQPRKPKSRKDRARWCGGHVGREHVLTIVEANAPRSDGPCGWKGMWNRDEQAYGPGWRCVHEEICDTCGRRFRYYWQLPAQLCPHWPGTKEAHQAAMVEAVKMQRQREERAAKWAARFGRKQSITGPQGYRRSRPQ